MKYWTLFDLEKNQNGLLMHFEDQISAERAVKTALRKPDSIYAQFPDKFELRQVLEVNGPNVRSIMDIDPTYKGVKLTDLLEVK